MSVWVREHHNLILEYCSLYIALSTFANSLFYHSQVNAKDVNRFQLVGPTCLTLLLIVTKNSPQKQFVSC